MRTSPTAKADGWDGCVVGRSRTHKVDQDIPYNVFHTHSVGELSTRLRFRSDKANRDDMRTWQDGKIDLVRRRNEHSATSEGAQKRHWPPENASLLPSLAAPRPQQVFTMTPLSARWTSRAKYCSKDENFV